jgi:hypothetical protein
MKAEDLYRLFVHRKDVYAIQTNKGAYVPVKKEITISDIESHLKGEKTIGLYCLEKDNTVKWACVDMDLKKACSKCGSEHTFVKKNNLYCQDCKADIYDEELKNFFLHANMVYESFLDYNVILEFSGRKGYHIWILFDNPIHATLAKQIVTSRLNRLEIPRVEVFPKQTELSESLKYGNLVKIPFATHKVSGQKSYLIKENLTKRGIQK